MATDKHDETIAQAIANSKQQNKARQLQCPPTAATSLNILACIAAERPLRVLSAGTPPLLPNRRHCRRFCFRWGPESLDIGGILYLCILMCMVSHPSRSPAPLPPQPVMALLHAGAGPPSGRPGGQVPGEGGDAIGDQSRGSPCAGPQDNTNTNYKIDLKASRSIDLYNES